MSDTHAHDAAGATVFAATALATEGGWIPIGPLAKQRQRREVRKHLLSLPREGALDGHLPKEAGRRATRASKGEGYRCLKGEYCFSLGVMFVLSLLLLHAGAASPSAWPLRERRAHDEHLCSDSRAYRGFTHFRISCAV